MSEHLRAIRHPAPPAIALPTDSTFEPWNYPDSGDVVTIIEPCPGPPHHGFHGPGKDNCSGWLVAGFATIEALPIIGMTQAHSDQFTMPFAIDDPQDAHRLCLAGVPDETRETIVRVAEPAVRGGVVIIPTPIPVINECNEYEPLPHICEGLTHDGPQWFYDDGDDMTPVPAVGSPIQVDWQPDGRIGTVKP